MPLIHFEEFNSTVKILVSLDLTIVSAFDYRSILIEGQYWQMIFQGCLAYEFGAVNNVCRHTPFLVIMYNFCRRDINESGVLN